MPTLAHHAVFAGVRLVVIGRNHITATAAATQLQLGQVFIYENTPIAVTQLTLSLKQQ